MSAVRRRTAGRCSGLLACAGAIWIATMGVGCSDAQLDAAVQKVFKSKKSPQQQMLVAVSDNDPDLRRSAVAEMARSKAYDDEWAIKGFIAIALLESNSQTRCVAIRALTRTGDPRATDTLLKILGAKDDKNREVRIPDDVCRGDATLGLSELSAAGKVPAEFREETRDALLLALSDDPNRFARAAAAQGLGYYSDDLVVSSLITGLKDTDFAVVRTCEDALVRLTGVTHQCSYSAWRTWLEANKHNLFASAGQVPESRRLPYKNKVEKSMYDTRQMLDWMFPGKKEQ